MQKNMSMSACVLLKKTNQNVFIIYVHFIKQINDCFCVSFKHICPSFVVIIFYQYTVIYSIILAYPLKEGKGKIEMG